MASFEYKVINAPRKPGKARGVRGFDDKYAHTLSELMNEMAVDGWEYARAESIPVDEKSGLMGKISEKYLTLMVFRRPAHDDVPAQEKFTKRTKTQVEPEPIPEPVKARREPTLNPVSGAEDTSASDPMRLNKPLSDDEFAENIRGLMDKESD